MYSLGTCYACRHSHENNVCKHTEWSFNSIQREYSTGQPEYAKNEECLQFLIIYGYLFESNHLGKPSF